MLGYLSGAYDVLRQKDLSKIDKAIQKNLENGNDHFALAIYSDELCEALGLGAPLKSAADRMNIAKYLSGVDFTFEISSIDKAYIEMVAEQALEQYLKELEEKKPEPEKEFDIAYVPGTYDLFHAGHLENILQAAQRSEKVIMGVKADELVLSHKGRLPMINAHERMEILRHFKFVDNVYQYYTRDPHAATTWIKAKYGKDVDAIFLGSDLKNDFKDIKDIKLIFTDRDPNVMQSRSTTAYRNKLLNITNYSTLSGKFTKPKGNNEKDEDIEIGEK